MFCYYYSSFFFTFPDISVTENSLIVGISYSENPPFCLKYLLVDKTTGKILTYTYPMKQYLENLKPIAIR